MKTPLTSWIAGRYLRSRSAGRFAPLLSVTAVAGVAVGTMALIVVMSVMLGFRKELARRLMGFNAHVTLTRSAEAEDLSAEGAARLFSRFDVRDIAPFVQGEVIAAAYAGDQGPPAMPARRTGNVQGARVRGMDPHRMGALEGIELYMPKGEATEDLSGAIVGSEVAANLMVHPDFGDVIELTAPLADVGPTGELIPNRRRFRVAGVFRAGIYEYDNKYILVGLDDARRLLGEQAAEGWHIRLADPADAPEAVAQARGSLPGGWRAAGFDEHNRKLFAALKLERAAMGAILVLVLMIASCAIAGVVLLITAAKRKDVAILQSIGLGDGAVRRIFLMYAALIGLLGSGAGLLAGMAAMLAAQLKPIRLPDSYYLDYLPVDLNVPYAFLFALVGVAVAVLASLYPVRQAARQAPVEVIRYE